MRDDIDERLSPHVATYLLADERGAVDARARRRDGAMPGVGHDRRCCRAEGVLGCRAVRRLDDGEQ